MKHFAALFFVFAAALSAQTSTSVTATGLASGATQMCFLGTDANNNPVTYTPSGGTATSGTVCFAVTSGTLANGSTVANVATASPSGLVYRVSVINGTTVYLTVPGVAISGTVFSFNSYGLSSTQTATGIGTPTIGCAYEAAFTSTSLPDGQNSFFCNTAGRWQASAPTPYCPVGQAYAVPTATGKPSCLSPSTEGIGPPTGLCIEKARYTQADGGILPDWACVNQAWIQLDYRNTGLLLNPTTSQTVTQPTGTSLSIAGQTNTTSLTNSGQITSQYLTTKSIQGGGSFGGNKSFPSGGSPDNGAGDRHTFNFRLGLSDWDAATTGAAAPTFVRGNWASSTPGTHSVMARTFFVQNAASYTVQGLLYYGTNTGNFLGVSTLTAAVDTTGTSSYEVGFTSAGFVSRFANTVTTLVPASSLSAGYYVVSMIGVNGNTLISVQPFTASAGITAYTFVAATAAPNANSIQVESTSADDKQAEVRFVAGSDNPTQINVANSDSESSLPTSLESLVAGVPSQVATYVIIPKSYRIGVDSPWIVYDHGDSGLGNYIFAGNQGQMFQTFSSAGYVIVSSDYSSTTCWGNPQCVVDNGTVQAQYQQFLYLAPQPYVVMESMGGAVALNSIVHGTLNPRAVFGLYPVTNLANLYGGGAGVGSADYAPHIQTAYGFSSPAGYAAATAGYDPNLAPVSNFAGIPFLISSSYGDTVVPRAQNTDLFAAAVNGAGGSVTVYTSTGNHGDPSNFITAQVLTFFAQH